MSEPASIPIIVAAPASTQPTKGTVARLGETAAPTDAPTSLPDCSPPPTALIQAIDFFPVVAPADEDAPPPM